MPEAPPSEKAVSDITPEALLEAIGYSPEQFLAHRPPTRPPPAAGQLAVRKEDLDFIQSDRCARFYGTNPQERMFAYADKEGDRFYLNLQSVYHKNGFHDSHVFTSLHSAAQYFPAVRSARSAGRPLLAWEVVRKGRPCKGYLDVEVEPRSLWTGELSVLVPLVIEAWNTVLARAGLPATSLQHVPITDATSADKLSAHFVFLDCWFANNAELGAFVKHVRQALLDMEPGRGGSFVGQDGKRTVALDMVVFSANRGMRLIYSHKLSKHKYAERPLLPWAGNARQFDDLDYVITYMPEEWKAARPCVDVSRLPALQGLKAARVFAPYVPPEGMLNPISPKALCALVDDFEVHDGSGEPRGLGFELVDGVADSTGKFHDVARRSLAACASTTTSMGSLSSTTAPTASRCTSLGAASQWAATPSSACGRASSGCTSSSGARRSWPSSTRSRRRRRRLVAATRTATRSTRPRTPIRGEMPPHRLRVARRRWSMGLKGRWGVSGMTWPASTPTSLSGLH